MTRSPLLRVAETLLLYVRHRCDAPARMSGWSVTLRDVAMYLPDLIK